MAQVTYQALFRSFPKLCGMTGTALTDANELEGTYGLQVVQARRTALCCLGPWLWMLSCCRLCGSYVSWGGAGCCFVHHFSFFSVYEINFETRVCGGR